MTTKPRKVETTRDGFTPYKRRVEVLLKGMGWSTRGIFYAFIMFKIADAHSIGEAPEVFASRVDRDAPLGMASR